MAEGHPQLRMAYADELFRAINRRLFEQDGEGPYDLICECSDPECATPAKLTRSQFDAICGTEDAVVLGRAHSE
jgi:hypothetical protein